MRLGLKNQEPVGDSYDSLAKSAVIGRGGEVESTCCSDELPSKGCFPPLLFV